MGKPIKWNMAAYDEIRTMPSTKAAVDGAADKVRQRAAVSYTHLTLPTNREV